MSRDHSNRAVYAYTVPSERNQNSGVLSTMVMKAIVMGCGSKTMNTQQQDPVTSTTVSGHFQDFGEERTGIEA